MNPFSALALLKYPPEYNPATLKMEPARTFETWNKRITARCGTAGDRRLSDK
jgi:hypothetical protein